jgi:hypothetical protein
MTFLAFYACRHLCHLFGCSGYLSACRPFVVKYYACDCQVTLRISYYLNYPSVGQWRMQVQSHFRHFWIRVATCQMVYLHTENSSYGTFWKALCRKDNFGYFYGHFVYFLVIWYILCPFLYNLCSIGSLFYVWVCFTKKNMATLLWM